MSEIEYRSNAPGQLAFTPAAVRNTGQRRNRYTWMMALKPTQATLGASDGGTEFQCIDIPDDFYAVRVGFMNATTTAWDVTMVKAVGSAPTSSYVVPIDEDGNTLADDEWSTLTFVGGGENLSEIVTIPGATPGIVVLENGTDPSTGQTDNPQWTMTDWVPCSSRGADPVTGMRRLMIRALIPSSQDLTYNNMLANSVWPGNPDLNRGYVFWLGGADDNADYVTSPSTGDSLTNSGNAPLVNGNIVAMVQVLTRRPCVQGMHTGDSTMAGTGTTASIYTMSLIAGTTLGQEYIDVAPVGVACAATGGQSSGTFFARMATMLPIVQPTYCILPGWTSNDYNVENLTPDQVASYFSARLRNAADVCRANDVVPIFCTPWGYTDIPAELLPAWRELRARVLALAESGNVVVDQFALCGDVSTAAYFPGMEASGLVHPTDAANIRATQVLIPAIKRVAGL